MTPQLPTTAGLSRRGFLIGTTAVTATGLLAACGTSGTSAKPGASDGKPRTGGTFRIGVEDASAKDTLDPALAFSGFATMYCRALFDSLVKEDPKGAPYDSLAESFEPNQDASEWTIRIKKNVTFHDGKPLTIDDVIFTIERAMGMSASLASQNLASLDPKGMKKVDEHTVRLAMKKPNAFFKEVFFHASLSIVPRGFDPKKPVGSGPFVFERFANQRFSAKRNEQYWDRKAYLDRVEIIGFADPNTARMNALLSGQIDAMTALGFTQAPQVQANSALQLLSAPGAAFEPFTMRVDQAPFKDPRVLEAFKLMIDREQMVKNVYDGRGRVGNDLGWIQDPFYAGDIPQRAHDPEKAKSLLKAAGLDGMKIDLHPSPEAPWNSSAAQVFAQQAKAAGVSIKLKNAADLSAFYDKTYLKVPFSQDMFGPNPLSVTTGYSLLPDSPYNESHWKDPRAAELFALASAAGDDEKRRGYLTDFQQLVHDKAGWIVWGFRDSLQAASSKFGGLTPSLRGINQYDLTGIWMK